MCVFDLSGDKPVLTTNDIWLQRDVETLFNYKDKMFMGTPTGMLIYSLEDPLAPKYRSSVSHVFGCDPVVVEDDLAYVTVHSGNTCGQNTNELMLIAHVFVHLFSSFLVSNTVVTNLHLSHKSLCFPYHVI